MSLGPVDYERALAAAGLSDIAVFHRTSTGSTNDDARTLVGEGRAGPESAVAVVVAETQTRGRGRGANPWVSPLGSISLTITVPGVKASRINVLPLGVGAAVTGALRVLGARACVKWPNDVLIDDEKVCGILCESSLLGGAARIFVGIGINVDRTDSDTKIPKGATTLAAHEISVHRPALVAEITARVVTLIRSETPATRIIEDWKAVSVPWWGEEVSFVEGDIERRVTLLDVNPEGQLVVRDEGGVVRSLVAGEVRRVRISAA